MSRGSSGLAYIDIPVFVDVRLGYFEAKGREIEGKMDFRNIPPSKALAPTTDAVTWLHCTAPCFNLPQELVRFLILGFHVVDHRGRTMRTPICLSICV